MATIATLNVNLTAGTARFQKGMQGARSEVGSLTKSLSAMRFAVTNYLVNALGNIASKAISGLVSSLGDAAKALDKTNDLAERLGSSSRDLQVLAFAAEQNGSSFEGMAAGVEKMTKSLGEASKTDVFASLGLDQAGLAQQSTLQAFSQIADAINQLPTAAARYATATQIFGRGGTELIQTLALGSEGLRQMASEADALGLTMSEADIKGVASMNDSLDKLGAMAAGVNQHIMAGLAPAVKYLTDGLTDFVKTNHLVEGMRITFQMLGLAIESTATIAQLAFRGLEIAMLRLHGSVAKFLAGLPAPVAKAMGIDQAGMSAMAKSGEIYTNMLDTNLKVDTFKFMNAFPVELGRAFTEAMAQAAPAIAQRIGPTLPVGLPPLSAPGAGATNDFVRLGSPGAVEKGSSAAYSAIVASERPWMKLEQIAQKQLGVNEALLREVRAIDFGLQGPELVGLPS